MNPSRIFILRPVATSLLMVALLLAGLVSYVFLPISALPSVDYPTIQVQTYYPGASPEVMTSAITAPLERQFGQMPSLDQMSSRSSAGASIITLQFNLTISLDIAEQEVQAAINAAGNLLPSDLPAPPIYAKVNPADAPILTLAITSETMPLSQVQDLVDTRLAQKLSQVEGVGLVSLSGGQRPAMRIRANPQALAAYGLNLDDLRTTISNLNVNTPKGNFDGPSQSLTINANDQLQTPGAYADSIIAFKNGAPVRLSDVATVEQSAENLKLGAWFNGTPAIILNVQRQPGANVIRVVDRIKLLLPELQTALPASVQVTPVTDRTLTIRASVTDVQFELAVSAGLVVLVMFLFLRNWPATIISSLSVPLSIVGTLIAVYLIGFSLNNLTLMALTIATGFVVDDAIVMIENIARHIEAGEEPMEASLNGSRQIAFTIISLTISLIAVLIPLLFMGDIIGRLFHEFAVTLAITIVISAVVSLTLVPMMCARLMRAHGEARTTRPSRFSRLLDAGVRGYGRALDWVLDREFATLVIAGATLVLTAVLYIEIPKGFFPAQDTSLVQATTQASQAISFGAMAEHQQAVAAVALKDPDVVSLTSFIGVDGSNVTLNSGRLLINLKPRDERIAGAPEIIARLQVAMRDVPGINVSMQPVQDLTIDTITSAAQYQFVLQNANPAEFGNWVPKLVHELQNVHEITDVSTELQDNGLAAYVEIDRAAAARFGITPAIIDNALYDAFGQRVISTIFTQSNQYRVILEVDPRQQRGVDTLTSFPLPSAASSTGRVPLSAVSTISVRRSPLTISHLGQFPSTTISFNLAEGASLGAAVEAIRDVQAEIGLPQSFITKFQGAAGAFQSSRGNQLLLILAAVVTMYIVLGVLYESFIHPITILSTLPSAGVGALVALMLAGMNLDVIGIIGIILLIGIVKKNAIMMIDFALVAERVDGLAPREAIHQACMLRLRPILMTTFAALFGALPLVIGNGSGSELRQPLGIAIIGGLLVSQLLTLFTTPVIYLALGRLGARIGLRDAEPDAEATP